jgi:citrate synthase
VILGAAEAAGRLLAEVRQRAEQGTPIAEAAATVVRAYRAERRAIPGYGHPLHKGADPRAARLFEVAAELGCAGQHIASAQAVEQVLPAILGKPLVLNVSGAIPAVLLDAGYPLTALKGIPILARTASLIAHLTEEQTRPIGFVLSHAASQAVDYDGPAPEGFRESDE